MAGNILKFTGNTPLIRLNNIEKALNSSLYAKAEFFNPSGSVKMRIALAMIENAEQKGIIHSGATVIEPTSGNTGIGLAVVCAVKKYTLILTMPEHMSEERKILLKSLGAELVLTPASEGMGGAVSEAEKLLGKIPGSWMPDQFSNPANPHIHEKTTAVEILNTIDHSIDYFIAGIGTGGTITGVSRSLKQYFPQMKTIGVEPAGSPVLSGGKPGPHGIAGIGAGFVPAVLNRSLIDEIITIKDDEAASASRMLAAGEGLFCGISSGAALAAAIKIASRRVNRGKTIVLILPDTGERYLSTSLWKE